MPVFGSRDRVAPLLTHVFQLDTDDIADLRLFVANCDPNFCDSDFYAQVLIELQDLCRLAQRMMFTIHDRGVVYTEDWVALREWRRRFYVDSEYVGLEHLGGLAEIRLVDLKVNYVPIRTIFGIGGRQIYPLSVKIVNALWLLVHHREPTLRRCNECHGIFVFGPQQPDQQFCSLRCADRATARRQRSERSHRF